MSAPRYHTTYTVETSFQMLCNEVERRDRVHCGRAMRLPVGSVADNMAPNIEVYAAETWPESGAAAAALPESIFEIGTEASIRYRFLHWFTEAQDQVEVVRGESAYDTINSQKGIQGRQHAPFSILDTAWVCNRFLRDVSEPSEELLAVMARRLVRVVQEEGEGAGQRLGLLTTAISNVILKSFHYACDEKGNYRPNLVLKAFAEECGDNKRIGYVKDRIGAALFRGVSGKGVQAYRDIGSVPEAVRLQSVAAYEEANLITSSFWHSFCTAPPEVLTNRAALRLLHDKLATPDGIEVFNGSLDGLRLAGLYVAYVLKSHMQQADRDSHNTQLIRERTWLRNAATNWDAVAVQERYVTAQHNEFMKLGNRPDKGLMLLPPLDPMQPTYEGRAFFRLLSKTSLQTASPDIVRDQIRDDIMHSEIVAWMSHPNRDPLAVSVSELALRLPQLSMDTLRQLHQDVAVDNR